MNLPEAGWFEGTRKSNNMKKNILLLFSLIISALSFAQTNILTTNPIAEQIMLGNYNPTNYAASTVIDLPAPIVSGINSGLSADSLKSYLFGLRDFENRNTGSDTVSTTRGIGAARRWTYAKFQEFSGQNENRLVTSYLQFDQTICGIGQHRNIFTVLPGTNPAAEIILIEGHIDSRCEGACDIVCTAEGMEDNGSGTALVMELARVMSQFTFKNTIVFMATIGEEQGLYGADAFADYCVQKNINVKAVLNNDVIGGVICGQTSSAPSCPGLNHIDSTQVRIFSAGSWGSINKGLARFIKLQYQEELINQVAVPMTITLMSAEDRTGRGSDHIPFRQKGFQSIRFTSANEHGDASNGPGYTDRQHTHNDILGVDTDNDQVIDSFFVDFNYLSRNAVINGVSAAMAAIGPDAPDFTTSQPFGGVIRVDIVDPNNYGLYRIGFRSGAHDFDTIFTTTDLDFHITVNTNGLYYVSVAAVDGNNVESIFGKELREIVTKTSVNKVQEDEIQAHQNIFLHQNRPNPFDEATYIGFDVKESIDYNSAYLSIIATDGKEIERIPVEIKTGVNEVLYTHGYGVQGVYLYSLVIDGKVIDSKRMIFAF